MIPRASVNKTRFSLFLVLKIFFIFEKRGGVPKFNLKKKTVGVLGLAFKSETDDIRDSLSIKLLQLLKSKKVKTLQSDEYFKTKENIDKIDLIKKSDIIIVSTPHKAYKKLKIGKNKILVDIWGLNDKN